MLDAYLTELDAELRRRIPAGEVQARMGEVETHLREGVECRMAELGLDAQAAQRDAVAAFGDVRPVARAMQRQALIRLNGVRVLLVFLIQATLWLGNAAAMLGYGWATLGLWSATFVASGLFAGVSGRCRRPAPWRVLGASVAACVVLWLASGVVWLQPADFGGIGTVERWNAASEIEGYRMSGDEQAAQAIERARSEPVANLAANLNGSVEWAKIAVFPVVGFDLLCGGLGALAAGVRRRPRPGGESRA